MFDPEDKFEPVALLFRSGFAGTPLSDFGRLSLLFSGRVESIEDVLLLFNVVITFEHALALSLLFCRGFWC